MSPAQNSIIALVRDNSTPHKNFFIIITKIIILKKIIAEYEVPIGYANTFQKLIRKTTLKMIKQ